VKRKIDRLYEEYAFYQEYLEYLESVEREEIRRDLQKIAREIVKTKIEQAIFAIVIQSVDDPSVAANYIASFRVISTGNENAVFFSPVTPVIGYLESGIQPFSMKEKLLATGNVKISKKGFPYKTVPLRHDAGSLDSKMDTFQRIASRTASTEAKKTVLTSKEIEIQSKINTVLQKTKFSFLEDAKDAEGRSIKRSIAKNPLDLGTLIKEETFEAAAKTQKVVKTKYVIFRTVSAKHGSAAWNHPGFSGKEIYKKIIDWKNENEERLFADTLDSLLAEAFGDL